MGLTPLQVKHQHRFSELPLYIEVNTVTTSTFQPV
jgi:hypothetical protein